ncbi:MAG: hypothetical protein ACFB12_11440 [Leptolyngbyaceae cyanobacterium]
MSSLSFAAVRVVRARQRSEYADGEPIRMTERLGQVLPWRSLNPKSRSPSF